MNICECRKQNSTQKKSWMKRNTQLIFIHAIAYAQRWWIRNSRRRNEKKKTIKTPSTVTSNNATSINLWYNKYKMIMMIIVMMVKYNEKLLKEKPIFIISGKKTFTAHISRRSERDKNNSLLCMQCAV